MIQKTVNTVLSAIEKSADQADGDDLRHRWTTAVHAVMRGVIARVATQRDLPAPDWNDEPKPADPVMLDDLGDVSGWGSQQIGEVYGAILDMTPQETDRRIQAVKLPASQRKDSGAWYTPAELAEFMARFTLTPQRRCPCGAPACGLKVTALDPACGAGVFLIAAARRIADVYASILTGQDEPPEWVTQTVLPLVMGECVYGIDTDPIAVDLARSMCWLEVAATRSITWMDDNIVHGDALTGNLPEALAKRVGGPDPLVIIGNPPYKEHAKDAAPWIEARRASGSDELIPRPSLDEFRKPGNGRLEHKLSNLYVFFLRWALWQALEAREAPGVVAFITPNTWLTANAYEGMRTHMRRVADEIHVVDISPEGHQAPVPNRLFPTVKTPLCIAIFTEGDRSEALEQVA